MVHLDYRDARPIYCQIEDGIREQILTGVLQQGDKLPSVRELEMQGWIASVPGKGSFVCGIPSGPQREQLALLENLDKIVDGLLALGTTREELIERIKQGGNHHA